MQVEWDEEKNLANIRKHRFDFETAEAGFDDPFRTDTHDDRENYGEERWIATGYAGFRFIMVVYDASGSRRSGCART